MKSNSAKRFGTVKWVTIVVIFLLLSNVPPLKSIYTGVIDDGHYRYSNANGSFTVTDINFKPRRYNLSKVVPAKYKQIYPTSADTTVYRLFDKNPLCYWRWYEYFVDNRYKLPYKSWNEIRSKRGYDLEYANNMQDF